MSPYHKKQKDKRRKNLFRKWHRRIGFTAALFLFNLAITGILLNHSDDLDLHKQYIKTDWLVNLYGVKAPESGKCILVSEWNKNICQLGEKIYLNNLQLLDQTTDLIGAVEFQGLFYLATTTEILIYSQNFELVDRLKQDNGLPVPVGSIGLYDNKLGEKTTLGILISTNQYTWSFNQNDFSWNKTDSDRFVSKPLLPLQGKPLISLQNIYLDSQITQLKFIQDLHSGSILSLPGKLLTDLVGIIIILLAASGFFAWQRRKEKVD